MLPSAAPDSGVATHYRVEITGRFETEVQQSGEDPRLLPSMEQRLILDLHLQRARGFRDGSEGILVWVERAGFHLTVSGQPEVVGVSGLQGRSFEFRRFPDGEILDVDLEEHIVGQGRNLDVYDLLLPVLSPSAPALKEGESRHRVAAWKLNPWPESRWNSRANLEWVHRGGDELGEFWNLSYEGAWVGTGEDGRTPQQPRFSSDGSAAGEVRISTVDHSVLEHGFHWHRLIRGEFDGDGEGVRVLQRQDFDGTVVLQGTVPLQGRAMIDEALPSVVQDSTSLPRYLDPWTVHAALVARQMGKICVCGAHDMDINYAKRTLSGNGVTLKEGDFLSLNGFV
ncbi:MAG: PEP-utilizing enzyme, partial [Myxococcota bacterium]|nr:PEP-utilizing enzyme [Myxococcota bacterium]